MISKLPGWILSGAWGLAFIAGIVNVVGLLGFRHEAITHLTGNTSLLAEAVVAGHAASALHLAAILGAFVAGCVASGFIIQDSTLQLGRRYGVALILVSALLFLSIPLFEHGSNWGMYAAAGACGLQNAMVSTYSGAVVRTTHLSGMFTDLGISIGQALRGRRVDPRRVRLCALIISGFFCGGVVGAAAFGPFGYRSLLLPAGLTALAAVAYGAYRYRQRPAVGGGSAR